MNKLDWYDRAFRALGDETRLQILEMLRDTSMNAAQVLARVKVVQSTLSHHMKMLCESQLVDAKRSGKNVYYSLNKEKLAEAAQLLNGLAGAAAAASGIKLQPESDHPKPEKDRTGKNRDSENEKLKKGKKEKNKGKAKSVKNDKDPDKRGKKSKEKSKNKKKNKTND